MNLNKAFTPLEMTRYLQLINGEVTAKEVSKLTGLNQNLIDKLHTNLVNQAHLVFQPNMLDVCIDTLAINNKLNIIQIGSNDGKTDDPIYKKAIEHGRKILLIEPQKYYREILLDNYSNFKGELNIENVAIGDNNKQLKFHILKEDYWDEYKIKFGKAPNFLFSFNKNQLAALLATRLGVNISDIEQYMTTLEVEILPLNNLIEKYDFKDIDLLQIDAEGYDFQIINSLGGIKPKLINFESFRLTEEEWNGFKNFCEINNFGFIQGANDTIAIYGSKIKYELYKVPSEARYRIT